MTRFRLYIVDDDELVRGALHSSFENTYDVDLFDSAEAALEALSVQPPDLVLLDLGLPGMSGIEALKTIKERLPATLVVIITAYEDADRIISAMKSGAYDYIVKPLELQTLEVTVKNALETIRLRKEIEVLQKQLLVEHLPAFIGTSDTIQDVMGFVASVAQSPDTPVLIEGETGTGKEIIAAAIHYRSPNFRGPIVSINCAAIPKELIESELFGYEKGAFTGASASGKSGMVEQAEGGTLFLDEVGDLSPESQAKLLRFIEEGEFYRVGGTKKLTVRTRVVSATNRDLQKEIDAGKFRRDLYYRLAVVKVRVPSLNERPGDIVPIALHFLHEFGRKFGKEFTGITPDAQEALTRFRWKGNVRELRNLVERGVLVGRGPQLTIGDVGLPGQDGPDGSVGGEIAPGLPPIPTGGVDLPEMIAAMERHYYDEALARTGGNETRAASLLGINHHTFRYQRRKMAQRDFRS
jgi:DNA-binding NtrC family response regulator